jgi:hypothetical protein
MDKKSIFIYKDGTKGEAMKKDPNMNLNLLR